jgi:hypothetical protein
MDDIKPVEEVKKSTPVSQKFIELDTPLKTTDGRTLTALTFRRPKAKDLKAMDAYEGEVTKSLVLVPRLCLEQISPEDVDELDGADALAIRNIMGEFVTRVQR